MLYRYHIKVHYRTTLMDKVTGYMKRILPEWERDEKYLVACKTFEITTSRPLSDSEIAGIKACREDWMDEMTIERVA